MLAPEIVRRGDVVTLTVECESKPEVDIYEATGRVNVRVAGVWHSFYTHVRLLEGAEHDAWYVNGVLDVELKVAQ